MNSYIESFLSTEITCIPKLLHKYVGNYYNNAVCNAVTWLFLFWCILHYLFERVLNAFLKKLNYKKYIRERLIHSLWYLGFYGTALFYCGATVFQNEIELFNFKKMHVLSPTLPPHLVLGYSLLNSFYYHSAAWEGFRHGSLLPMARYFLLSVLLTTAYILSVTIYLILIPISFVVPMAIRILADFPHTLMIFLFILMIFWLMIEIYKSALYQCIYHCIYFNKECKMKNSNIIDCSIFDVRDDEAYNLQLVRREIKANKEKMMSLRKPKNRNALIQTLKCMVAIKKKLKEKCGSESSDSDDTDDSDKSDESDEMLIRNEAGDNDVNDKSEREETTDSDSLENKEFTYKQKGSDSEGKYYAKGCGDTMKNKEQNEECEEKQDETNKYKEDENKTDMSGSGDKEKNKEHNEECEDKQDKETNKYEEYKKNDDMSDEEAEKKSKTRQKMKKN